MIGLRNVLSISYTMSCPLGKLNHRGKQLQLFFMSLYDNSAISSSIFEQDYVHSYVKLSRPILMKRLENAVSQESSRKQNNPSSSSSGNPMCRITGGQVPLVWHITTLNVLFRVTLTFMCSKTTE